MTAATKNPERHQRRIAIQTLREELAKAKARRADIKAELEFLTNRIVRLESELHATEARKR